MADVHASEEFYMDGILNKESFKFSMNFKNILLFKLCDTITILLLYYYHCYIVVAILYTLRGIFERIIQKNILLMMMSLLNYPVFLVHSSKPLVDVSNGEGFSDECCNVLVEGFSR